MLGTDPEVFIVDRVTGNAKSAHLFFPFKGAKINVGKNAKLFRDGYALEVNVTPTPLAAFHTKNLSLAFQKAAGIIGPENMLLAQSTVKMDPHEIADAPEDMKSFGCDPSYDAYDLCVKRPEIDALVHGERYAGCHIHYSNESAAFLTNKKLLPTVVKLLDLFVGLPQTYITASPAVFARRQYYGQAGEFRFQTYPDGTNGLEYRTPGSETLRNNTIFELACRTVQHVCDNYESFEEKFLEHTPWTEVRKAINTGKKMEDILGPVMIPGVFDFGHLGKLRTIYRRDAGHGQPFAPAV